MKSELDITMSIFNIRDFHDSYSSTPHTLSIDPADFLLFFQKQLEPFTEIDPHCLPFDRLEVNL